MDIMKRIVYILAVLLLSCNLLEAQRPDSSVKAGLGSRIEEYFGSIAGESLDVQKAEADFMIELSEDSLIRQFTAAGIYEHYMNSHVMGAENVAVHVFDRWFADGPLKMEDDMAFLNARIHADFNRQSLIGNKAPELVMTNMDGMKDTLRTEGMYSVLFFYDTDCPKCRMETILLDKLLAAGKYPVRFISVYVGDDFREWREYQEKHFLYDEDIVESYSYYDPEIDSDYQRKYGILQTPRMFLTDPEGVIIGRGLDTEALSEMLSMIFDAQELEYGSDESAKLFDAIFEGPVAVDDVKRIADYIEDSTLGQGNPVMFRQLTGDFLYWISNRSGEAFKEGADYLVDNKILSRPDIWKSADDSLKVVGLAKFMDGLLGKAEPGTFIAPIKVPGKLLKSSSLRSGKFRLDRMRGRRNIILFHTEGCSNCAAEISAALDLSSKDRNIRILLVNVQLILATNPELASSVFEAFDLSALPYMIETDRKGLILRRYFSLLQNL